MNDMLFPICRSTSRLFLGGVAALSLMVASCLQAQTNFDFNASTDPGWEHFLPDNYTWGAPNFTNSANEPSLTFTTNDSSAGNMAYFFHAGTTNSTVFDFPRVGSFITNGTRLTNFTMTGEFFHWTNGQSQIIAIAGRVELPLPAVNPPNEESTAGTRSPDGFLLSYVNRRSTAAFRGATGGNDELRIHWINTNGTPNQLGNNGAFNGPAQATPVPGRSSSPDPTNGHYRLIFTANGTNVTGQIVDLSTGLPMVFGGPGGNTNILRTTIPAANNPYPGGAYGFYASMGDSPTPPLQNPPGSGVWDPKQGQPIDPHFDNFAIVPDVVTLESAALVTGPYVVDTTAGIEVYPKRITVPVNGDTRFYRINWIGSDHTPTITSITPGPTVNVVLWNSTTTTVTNAVKTMVLGYN